MQVFDCSFKPNVVSYSHSGSPLLTEDRFQLTVYYFDGDGASQEETVTMTVAITVNRSLDAIVTFAASNVDYLTVAELNGLSQPINSSFLRFRQNFGRGSACSVAVFSGRGASAAFPSNGVVVGADGAPMKDGPVDCREFLMEGLRYRHTGRRAPNVDYIPLAVEVEEEEEGEGQEAEEERERHVIRERIFVQVRITGAEENRPPSIAVNRTSVLRVQQFVALALDAEVLSVDDDDGPGPEGLAFEVTTAMDAEEDGFFVDLQRNSRRVRSFTADALASRHIAYHPPTKVLAEEKEVEVELVGRDDRFAASRPVRLRILVVPTRTNGPRIAFNGGLVVLEGGSRRIGVDDLRIVDADNVHGVEVHVKGGLRHGALEVNGRHGVYFTVSDMENRLVTYRHDNSDGSEDRIIVRVTDGRQGVRARIPVTVIHVDDNSPYLLTHEILEVQSGGYALVSAKTLNATDRDSKNARITYLLKTAPTSGEIIRRRSGLTKGFRIGRFTQEDVNAGKIFYRNFGGSSTVDSVEFRLLDDNDPPNRSGKYSLEVRIKPGTNLPPSMVEGID